MLPTPFEPCSQQHRCEQFTDLRQVLHEREEEKESRKLLSYFPSLFKGWAKSTRNYIVQVLYMYKHTHKNRAKQLHAVIILPNLQLQILSLNVGQCFALKVCCCTASHMANLLAVRDLPEEL